MIPLDMESGGTWQFLGIMAPIAEALLYGKTVVIDEFSSNLHPLVGRWIVSLFSSGNNPNGGQLIASTNDHTLMDVDNLLRRDQIYFTHRDSFTGETELYSLFDYDEGWDGESLSVRMPKMYQPVPFISEDRLLGL